MLGVPAVAPMPVSATRSRHGAGGLDMHRLADHPIPPDEGSTTLRSTLTPTRSGEAETCTYWSPRSGSPRTGGDSRARSPRPASEAGEGVDDAPGRDRAAFPESARRPGPA